MHHLENDPSVHRYTSIYIYVSLYRVCWRVVVPSIRVLAIQPPHKHKKRQRLILWRSRGTRVTYAEITGSKS